MLSFQSFEKLSKCELYQIYVDIFKTVEEKDDLIKNYVIQCSTYIKEMRQDGDQATYKKDQEVPHNLNNEYKVRTFPTFNIPENTRFYYLEVVWLRIWSMITQYRKASAFTHIENQQQKKR